MQIFRGTSDLFSPKPPYLHNQTRKKPKRQSNRNSIDLTNNEENCISYCFSSCYVPKNRNISCARYVKLPVERFSFGGQIFTCWTILRQFLSKFTVKYMLILYNIHRLCAHNTDPSGSESLARLTFVQPYACISPCLFMECIETDSFVSQLIECVLCGSITFVSLQQQPTPKNHSHTQADIRIR